MTSPIRTERHDNVLVVISDNPPVNALGQAVRAGLKDAIEEALADDGVEAVVIRCDGQTFFAGADITEFGKPPVGPNLPETLDAMEASDKPVVAAIHGTALGGGCEVALACHYRQEGQGDRPARRARGRRQSRSRCDRFRQIEARPAGAAFVGRQGQ